MRSNATSRTCRPTILARSATNPVATVWLAWLAVMAGANLPAPLYSLYAERFGFSSLVLTLVFATYAFVLVPTLLVFGRVSDRFGRRPVLLAGLAAACLALGVFAAATSTAWLFVARGLQGLAVGMISGTATAALVELEPRGGDRRRPAFLAGVAQAGGSSAGAVVAGALGQWAPAPTRLCYLVTLGATVAAAVLVTRVPEAAGCGERWRIQWPRVPQEVRRDFWRVGLTAGTAWGSAALFFSIVPSYASKLLHSSDLALLGAIAAVALAGSCVTQALARHAGRDARRTQGGGLVALVAGLVLLVLAAPVSSLALLLVGGAAVGVGHGLAIFAAQDELNALAPGARRGEVTAAFVCCIYLVVAVAVLSTGLLDLRLSLTTAVAGVASVLALVAFATATWQLASER